MLGLRLWTIDSEAGSMMRSLPYCGAPQARSPKQISAKWTAAVIAAASVSLAVPAFALAGEMGPAQQVHFSRRNHPHPRCSQRPVYSFVCLVPVACAQYALEFTRHRRRRAALVC